MKLVSSYKIVLDHPANRREDGVALFINSLSKPAATQQLTSVSSSKAKSWGEKRKKNGNQKFGWTEIFPFIYWLPFMSVCLFKKKAKNRGITKEQSVVHPF